MSDALPVTVPLSFDEQGSGPLLVLIHGITENRHSFDPITAGLAEHARVLRVDLRGHGDSPAGDGYHPAQYAADVHAVVEQVAGPDAVPFVVGHSLGGIVATAYAAAYPVVGVVNVDQPLALGALQEQTLGFEPMLRSELFQQVIRGMFAQMRGVLDDDGFDRIEELRRPDQAVVLGSWALMLDLSPEDLAAQVDTIVTLPAGTPYLALHGADLGEDYTTWLRERIPSAQVEVWSAGHYPHLVEPERFVERVVGLLV
ncbi:MAG: alpha/beta hydrolase [Cellulomonas sp.]|nr:alpha/beta hydrolase [Cellulomonas sp.]